MGGDGWKLEGKQETYDASSDAPQQAVELVRWSLVALEEKTPILKRIVLRSKRGV